MGTIQRPGKAAGATNYRDEVAAGVPDIIDAELDADFNTVYQCVNGQLDDANINVNLAGPKIIYEKLNLTGKIKVSDLIPGFQIPGGSIGPDTITTVQLAPGATTPSSINVPITIPGGGINPPHTEIQLASGVLTASGGIAIIVFTVAGYASAFLTGVQKNQVIVRIRSDGGATPLDQEAALVAASGVFPFGITAVGLLMLQAAGSTHTITGSIENGGDNPQVNELIVSTGRLIAIQFS